MVPRGASYGSVLPYVFVLALALALGFRPRSANAQSVGISPLIGSAGAGAEVSIILGPDVHVRAGGQYAAGDRSHILDRGGLSFDANESGRIGGVSIALDYWVSEQVFISAGLWAVAAEATGQVYPATPAEITGLVLEPSELGGVRVRLRWPEGPAPYVGVGIGNPLAGSRITPRATFGIVRLGRPEVSADAIGRLDANGVWADYLKNELGQSVWYPVATIGVGIRLDAAGRR